MATVVEVTRVITPAEVSDTDEVRIKRKCGFFWESYRKCLLKKSAQECEAEKMYELLVGCIGEQVACPDQAKEFHSCQSALRRGEQYQGRSDCNAEFNTLQSRALPVAQAVFDFPF
eukprot:Hpha_TRINITY_DN6374_c0_g1::TRINITY_DN6374_c0_g1_i1::g.145447::m.145447